MTAQPITITAPPWRASGSEIVYNLKDVLHNGSYAQEIISGSKRYTLLRTDSDNMEAIYTRTPEEPKTMTTPNTPQPEKVTAAELRAQFNQLTRTLDDMRAELDNHTDLIHQVKSQLEELVTGLQTTLTRAASIPTAPANTITFTMTAVTMATDDNGKTAYKARGPQFLKYGVRIWPEVLSALGIDEGTLKAGVNTLPQPIEVRATTKAGEDGSQQPHKVIGRA